MLALALAFQTSSAMPSPHMLAFGLALLLAAIAWLIFAIVRRVFKNSRDAQSENIESSPRIENSAAFMTASMQGVIRKLREQEKELERLHRIEKERAEHTERLSEEVTRNMPAGLLMVNSQGIIASANPAAEQVLGIRGLGYRRYSEVLGESSELTRLVGECLAQGKIFRREQVDHRTPAGDTRRLGVTISPVRAA
jgi:PAS domain-containing protein